MNREEKNKQTRKRIMDSALREFARQGYGASSINAVCGAEGISKGIIYHYFETKDDLYLACVEECFHELTKFLREGMAQENQGAEERLERYFGIRMEFFRRYPLYQRIFCDAVVMPPVHLKAAVEERKAEFDALNIEILLQILAELKLRPEITRWDAVDIFLQYQDFMNARYQMAGAEQVDIQTHEYDCHRALEILLYGVAERKGEWK
ncbi:MAG: TetR/AcrR family transcriptional regulator [Enterocloster asparagiformis]|nr:TetR/AcrR family transcriptional regulator [Enterocloster asparagiformis]